MERIRLFCYIVTPVLKRSPATARRLAFNPGDHICAVYSRIDELVQLAADFIVEGLRKDERCWYVESAGEGAAVSAALRQRGVKLADEIRRGAVSMLGGSAAYSVHGEFNPESTVKTFSDAIETALNDGYKGFRAAAEMSWALKVKNGAQLLIAYEALLRSLFTTTCATGLCLYHRERMPLKVLNGALVTHPIAGVSGCFKKNPFYDRDVTMLPGAAGNVRAKLRELAPASHSLRRR